MSAPCSGCKRPIAGDSTDPMTCVVDPVDGPLTLCTPCYEADPRKAGWTEWRAPTDPGPWPMLAEVGT